MRNLATVVLVATVLAALPACTKTEPAPAQPSAAPVDAPVDAPVAQPPAQPTPPPLPEGAGVTVLDAERSCTADADCTLTTADCCPCSALGKQTAIRKDKQEALSARRAPICAAVSCAQAMSDDPTCNATGAVCRDGMCVPDLGGGVKGGGAAGGVEPIR